ncbi:hypothetical protein JQY85_002347 [Escherichia coli]|nr:hypothetical protein [Escherichia coli]
MASFTVRVELVGASSDDYNRLHEAMESRRYFREIQDGAGNWFYLPDAEYTAEKKRICSRSPRRSCSHRWDNKKEPSGASHSSGRSLMAFNQEVSFDRH